MEKAFLNSIAFFSVFVLINPIFSATPRHRKIVYTLSNGMPLSIKGLPLIKKIAREKGYAFQVLNDPVMPVLNLEGSPAYPLLKKTTENVKRGLFFHFPSVLLTENSRPCGEAIPGYKTKEGFESVIKILESECASAPRKKSVNIKKPQKIPTLSKNHKVSLIREIELPRSIAYYFRPINNEWITYHTRKATYLFNLDSKQEYPFQGFVDSVPSPDAKLISLPANLRFFSLDAIFADLAGATKIPPLYEDTSMTDQYQSIGVLEEGVYRAITAWKTQLVSRDYSYTANVLSPLEAKKVLCSEENLSTPILAKNGKTLGAFTFGTRGTNTSHILSIGQQGNECNSVLDLGQRTSKIDFSHDNKLVTYIAINTDKQNLGAFVTDIENNKTYLLSEMDESEAITFPSFLPNGHVLLLRIQNSSYSIQELSIDLVINSHK